MQVKDFLEMLNFSGINIECQELGIKVVEEKVIVPKNLVIIFDGWEECAPQDCDNCELGGCCNLTSVEEVTIAKFGGKQFVVFERHRGYQKGSIWSEWQRVWQRVG